MICDMHNGRKYLGHVQIQNKLDEATMRDICRTIDRQVGQKLPVIIISPRTKNVPHSS